MTYPLFLLIFLVIPIAALGIGLRRRLRTRWWLTAVAVTIGVALFYTTPWDNYLVASGVWYYAPSRVWNIILGYVPLEEYLFFILQVILTGLITLWLLRRRPERA
ncbi:MAG: lycopene cyclase domain-containing protein [Anaerolineae bacterium]